MKTLFPAIIFLTSSWLLPQNEQYTLISLVLLPAISYNSLTFSYLLLNFNISQCVVLVFGDSCLIAKSSPVLSLQVASQNNVP